MCTAQTREVDVEIGCLFFKRIGIFGVSIALARVGYHYSILFRVRSATLINRLSCITSNVPCGIPFLFLLAVTLVAKVASAWNVTVTFYKNAEFKGRPTHGPSQRRSCATTSPASTTRLRPSSGKAFRRLGNSRASRSSPSSQATAARKTAATGRPMGSSTGSRTTTP